MKKIRMKNGRIFTLVNYELSDTHIKGKDKFGEMVILPLVDIDSMLDWAVEI